MTATATPLKTTPLTPLHEQAGAKLVDFAGWQMPLQFTKVKQEHLATRTAAGLFDIGHMGLINVSAASQTDALNWLDGLVGQDLSKLYPGKAVYTQLLNDKGGMLDDIIIYSLPDGELDSAFAPFNQVLVICNASRTKTVLDALNYHSHALPDIQLNYLSQSYSLLALQGPKFKDVLATVGFADAPPKRFHVAPVSLATGPALMARTGYTGEDGVELIVPSADVATVWATLMEKGQPLGLEPVGLAARDSLRTEAAYPLYGAELGEDITPLEAGLGWSVKLKKPQTFVGQSALLSQQETGLRQHLTCLKMLGRTIPRPGSAVLDAHGQPIGTVTSGCFSPTLGESIAMAYIQGSQPLAPGTDIQVSVRDVAQPATVVARPFYKPE